MAAPGPRPRLRVGDLRDGRRGKLALASAAHVRSPAVVDETLFHLLLSAIDYLPFDSSFRKVGA